MLGIINFLQKRPSDTTIRVGRIIFWLVLISSLYLSLIHGGRWVDVTFFDFSFFGFVLSNGFTLWENWAEIFKYVLVGIWIVPIFMGITNICFLKKKYMRIIQIIFAFVLFYIAAIIEPSPTLGVDVLIGFMGILPLIAGITGKCIVKKCLNYWEKITKIRV